MLCRKRFASTVCGVVLAAALGGYTWEGGVQNQRPIFSLAFLTAAALANSEPVLLMATEVSLAVRIAQAETTQPLASSPSPGQAAEVKVPATNSSACSEAKDRQVVEELLKAMGQPNLAVDKVAIFGGVGTGESCIVELDLNFRDLSGPIPARIAQLTGLRKLSMARNKLTGSIPVELAQLQSLELLDLGGNDLSGEIPPQLGELTALKELDLASNQLTGQIPVELSKLQRLRKLNLHINELSGPIPPELGNLTNLKHLRLYNNALSGSIPPELGKLTALETLELFDNQLSGEVPPELGNLVRLELLELHQNQLSGPLPDSFANLTKLVGLTLARNNGLCAPADKFKTARWYRPEMACP